MNALAAMLAVSVALMLAGCGGGSSPLAGMPGGGPELVASGEGTGPVARVGEGDGTSPTAPGDGSEGGGTGPVARVGEDGGSGDDGISWDRFLERLEYMGSGRNGFSQPKTLPGVNFEAQEDFRPDVQYWSRILSPSSPYCEGLYGGVACRAMKSRIAAAERLPGTRRFRGTLGVSEFVVDNEPWRETHPLRALDFYGGWLDNSVFMVGTLRGGTSQEDRLVADSIGREHGMSQFGYSPSNDYLTPSGIEDQAIRDEFAGVYRGEAVDMEGNWGTSEVNLAFKLNVPTPQYRDQDSATAIQVDLTIDIPAYGERSWRDDGSLFWDFSSADGDSRMAGEFYYGKEVGGVFQFPHPGTPGTLVMGAFGAKKVP